MANSRAAFKTIVDTFFRVYEDRLTSIVYTRPTGRTYNAATGAYQDSKKEYRIKVLMKSYSEEEQDKKNIMPNDRKCYVRGEDLPVVPALSDYIQDSVGNWDILDVKRDPGNLRYVLQLRRP